MSQPPPLPYAGRPSHDARCLGCGGGPLSVPSFTWWGGLVGQRLLGIEKCESCGQWWVKGTAKPGTSRIVIYAVVGGALGIALVVAISLLR